MLSRVYYYSEKEEVQFSKEWLTMCGRVPSVQVYRKHKYVSVIGFYSYFMFQRYWTKTKQKVYQKKRVCWNGRCIFCGNIATFPSYEPHFQTFQVTQPPTFDIGKWSKLWYEEEWIELWFSSYWGQWQKNLPSRRIEKARFKKCSQNTICIVVYNITLDVSFWYDFHPIITCGPAHLLHIQAVPCSSNVSSRQRWRRQMPGEKRILM